MTEGPGGAVAQYHHGLLTADPIPPSSVPRQSARTPQHERRRGE